MKTILKIILLPGILSAFIVNGYSQSTDINDSFYSEALTTDRQVDVHLPEGYHTSSQAYPVIYFLHGAGEDQDSYNMLVETVKDEIASGTIDPVILVKPDGSIGPYAGSFYTNSALYGNFRDYIEADLMEYVETTYRADTTARCIMGHSMGAYGAMEIGLNNAGKFKCIVAHSGPMDFSQFPSLIDKVLEENGNSAPYTFSPSAGPLTWLTFTVAGAFSPDLSNTNTKVYFPISPEGELIDSVFSKWLKHNPVKAAKEFRDTGIQTGIYFDVGTADEIGLYPFNVSFADSLSQLELPYTYESYEGGHSDKLTARFNRSIAYIDSVFKGLIITDTKIEKELPNGFSLSQNYPNPFNPSTVIHYQVPVNSRVLLKVYDLMGREVASLLNKRQNSGSYSIRFDARTLSSGVYFYRLTAGDRSITRKMLLIK